MVLPLLFLRHFIRGDIYLFLSFIQFLDELPGNRNISVSIELAMLAVSL